MKYLLLIPVVLLLAGCGYNYQGKGNDFVVYATIDHVGEASVTVDIDEIVEVHGKAVGWFDDGKQHQIHNNYNTCGFGSTRHFVGHAYDNDEMIALRDLREGDQVTIIGKIRDNAAACGKHEHHKNRPVFERIDY